MKSITPKQPAHLSIYAKVCLEALVDAGLANTISLGGAFGLFHYYDYRPTHDVDAWWLDGATEAKKQKVILEDLNVAGWIDVPLDSFEDLVSTKMNALVQRGAPRDFLDVFTICHADLVTIEECWMLWHKRQELIGNQHDDPKARLAIETHLSRIALQRPLEQFEDDEQREHAKKVREWFVNLFLQVKNG
jgi:hypothetical protein